MVHMPCDLIMVLLAPVEMAQWEAEKVKNSALTRLRRSAVREVKKLRKAGRYAAEAAANATTALTEALVEVSA